MAAYRPWRGRVPVLLGRRGECEVLDRLLGAVRAGESRALVVGGEPGAGKTALLEYLAGGASGCRVAAAAGVQSEMELAFAGLHQLCAPMLDRLGRLPVPQRDALRTAVGVRAGPGPDRVLGGLAVPGLPAEGAGAPPAVWPVECGAGPDPAPGRGLGVLARRVEAWPDPARRLWLLAAAEPAGDPALVWRAAGRLGIGADAAGPAADAGLAEFGARVLFRHPLVRSAAYRSASAREKQQVHRALPEATDPAIDPDRRAWHRAHAAPAPDENPPTTLDPSAAPPLHPSLSTHAS